ncbi:neuronal acetylcholine receptor subunit alpha-9-like [Glandiceps talaboti]
MLMKNYTKHMRPVKDQSNSLLVQHGLRPIQILDIDEKTQTITIKVWLTLTWPDEYLTWSPEVHNNITEFELPVTELWQPDITLYNSVTKEFRRHLDTNARVRYDGVIQAPMPTIIHASCLMDATYFPFDDQECPLKFGSWSYNANLVNLTVDVENVGLERYNRNGEWKLVAMPCNRTQIEYTTGPYADVTYHVMLSRRPLFYVLTMILPGVLQFILVLVGFYLPSECGERMTLFVTCTLSLMVFLTLISSYMPPNAKFTPYIEQYYIITIAMVVLSCVVSAWTINIHFQGPRCCEVPSWVRLLVLGCLATVLGMHESIPPYYQRPRQTSRNYVNSDEEMHLMTPVMNQNNECKDIQPLEKRSNVQSNEDMENCEKCGKMKARENVDKAKQHVVESVFLMYKVNEWRVVARVVDRTLLFLYAVTFISITVAYMFGLENNHHK